MNDGFSRSRPGCAVVLCSALFYGATLITGLRTAGRWTPRHRDALAPPSVTPTSSEDCGLPRLVHESSLLTPPNTPHGRYFGLPTAGGLPGLVLAVKTGIQTADVEHAYGVASAKRDWRV